MLRPEGIRQQVFEALVKLKNTKIDMKVKCSFSWSVTTIKKVTVLELQLLTFLATITTALSGALQKEANAIPVATDYSISYVTVFRLGTNKTVPMTVKTCANPHRKLIRNQQGNQ